jgi:xanthine dehydrogenase large subunit
VETALANNDFVVPPHAMQRGDPAVALAAAPHRLQGELQIGGQDHFYLEGQVSMALPQEDGDMRILTSSQHPTEVQHAVAAALGIAAHAVTVEVRRMGGAFGGKETQAAQWAVLAALAARVTGRAVKLRLDRDDDMLATGKRHEFRTRWDAGFDTQGRLQAVTFDLAARCGFSADLSGAIADRAMFHSDNAYYLPQVRIDSWRCRTNTVSNTAFRGFGGPQGMLGIERVMDAIAAHLGLDPLAVRLANLYSDEGRDQTPYGMQVTDNVLDQILPQLRYESDYLGRRAQIAEFNAGSRVVKRGIALTPVKFGISFTTTHLNQAGALLHIYTDGSVLLNHGGTEMGQGLMVKVAQVVADELGVPLEAVRVTATDTAKVPNTSATAASSGSDMNGMAARAAARKLRKRMARWAAQTYGGEAKEVVFVDGQVHEADECLTFAEVAHGAWMARVSLSATGYYRTPKIHYDRASASGRPFLYFAYGAAVSEVELDTLTGEYRLRRVDILHEVGRSLNPAIDLGQIEGGYIQGLGWLTTEELVWDADGRLRTHAPSTYKIPTIGDLPADFRVRIWAEGRNPEKTIHRSKAVGEPPLMLAISAHSALCQAVMAHTGRFPALDAPATPERLLACLSATSPCT